MIVKLLAGQRGVWWYSLASVVVTVILVSVAGVLYTRAQIDRANGKFCELIVLSDEAYQQPRPPGIPDSPTRQRLAQATHKLRQDLRCDER